MTTPLRRRMTRLALLATLTLPATLATPAGSGADGGLVRASAEDAGLVVTLFTSPTPLRVGIADVSVLVQDARTRAALLDADVRVRVEPAGGGAPLVDAPLDRATATNKLLQAALVTLPASGRFRLVAEARRGDATAVASAELEVAEPSPALLALWPLLALPPAVVGIFLVHQWLRRRSLGTARGRILAAAHPGRAAR